MVITAVGSQDPEHKDLAQRAQRIGKALADSKNVSDEELRVLVLSVVDALVSGLRSHTGRPSPPIEALVDCLEKTPTKLREQDDMQTNLKNEFAKRLNKISPKPR